MHNNRHNRKTVIISQTIIVPAKSIIVASLVPTNACFMTTPSNKVLQMDPLASRLVGSVTEYSATKGSSSFSNGHCPGMDTAKLLLALKQDTRSIESYIQEYLEIANYSDLPDCVLIYIFFL